MSCKARLISRIAESALRPSKLLRESQDFSTEFSQEDWDSFLSNFKHKNWDAESLVEPAETEGMLRLTKETQKDLAQSFETFTNGKAEEEYRDEAAKGLEALVKKAVDTAKKATAFDGDVEIEVTIDDEEVFATVSFNKEKCELKSDIYIGDRDFDDQVSDGFGEWEWLALLGHEESPVYSSEFMDGYVEVEKANTLKTLIEQDDHTSSDMAKQIEEWIDTFGGADDADDPDESNTSESIDFSKHIVDDEGKKVLRPDSPLFADMSVEELMDMTGAEIQKLWHGLKPDVYYSLSAFFTPEQLSALSDHHDKSIAKEAQQAGSEE